LLLDMEHSGFGYETVKNVIRFCEAAALPVIVRAPSREYHHIARACDAGAEGIMLPMVGTAAEARKILDAIKYHGEGRRGVALGIAHDRYRIGPTLEGLVEANKRTTVFLQIETAEGVENADAIAAVDGVDCLWIGHFDLSCSLGIPGRFDDRRFRDATGKVAEACRRHKKALGRLVPDVSTGVQLYREGFDFISFSGDVWLFQAAVAAGVQGLREGAAQIDGAAGAA